MHILLPVKRRATVEAHLIADETLAQEAGASSHLRLVCPIGLHRRGGRTDVTAASKDGPRSDPTLVRALRAAHAMVARDASGLPRIDVTPASPHQRRLIRLAFLSPELHQCIFDGRQPQGLALARLIEADIPLCWDAQERVRSSRGLRWQGGRGAGSKFGADDSSAPSEPLDLTQTRSLAHAG